LQFAISFNELLEKAFTADEIQSLLSHLPDVVEYKENE
jgi:hypothetical protein